MERSIIKPEQIRRDSLQKISELGLKPPEHLPLNDDLVLIKNSEAAGQRLSILNAVVSVCFGCPQWIAKQWLSNNNLVELLTAKERDFIYGTEPTSATISSFELSIESIWALLWALGQIPTLNHNSYCGDNLKELAPRVGDKNYSAKDFVAAASLRSEFEIACEADYLYCLDWFARKSEMNGQPVGLRVRAYVIRKRRHALSWLLSSDPNWDEVPLDT